MMYFADAADSLSRAIADIGSVGSKMTVRLLIPELDPQLDVYDRRVLLRAIWEIVIQLSVVEGKVVKLATQSPEKYGGLPISVAGLRKNLVADRALSAESWGDKIERVRIGDIGPQGVDPDDDVFLLVCPQNTVGAPVIDDVMNMFEVSGGNKPFVLFNPRLGDIPSHSGVMQVSGRDHRIRFINEFEDVYHTRLLYRSGTWYPVQGAITRSYPEPFRAWKRSLTEDGKDTYTLIGEFRKPPNSDEITAAFDRAKLVNRTDSKDDTLARVTLGLLAISSVLYGIWQFIQNHLPSQ